jgi:hypothetical protein
MKTPHNLIDSLPNTFILGAAKAGTTTLYDLLKQHPQVFLSFDKEPMFFSREDYFSRSVEWYINTFFTNSSGYHIRGEATPHYLYWAKKVSPRIRITYNTRSLKFIIILRNPIERAYSWYWNMVADGRENLSFWDALQAEDKRISNNWEKLEYYGSMQYGYFRGGCYASQIQVFLEDFQKNHFHFLLQEDLIQDPKKALRKLLDFLELENTLEAAPNISNPAVEPRSRSLQYMIRNSSRFKDIIKPFIPYPIRHKIKSMLLKNNLKRFNYPKMEERAYTYLKEKFNPEIKSLSDIIERDLAHWIK